MKRHLGLAVPAFMADSTAPRRWQEVTGARCRITGGNFHRAELVTPASAGGAGPWARCAGAAGGLRHRNGARPGSGAAGLCSPIPAFSRRRTASDGAPVGGGECS